MTPEELAALAAVKCAQKENAIPQKLAEIVLISLAELIQKRERSDKME